MIRLASLDEAAQVRELVIRAYAGYVPRIGRRPAPMDADYAALTAGEHVWVAADGAELTGVLVVELFDDHLLIENLAVEPTHQGAGVGSRLLAHAEALARQLGSPEIRLFTHELMTENVRFYGCRGYVETARRRDDGFSRVFFSKMIEGEAIRGKGPQR